MSSWGSWGLHTAAYDVDGNYYHVSSSTPYIARGINVGHPSGDLDLFHAINEHRATPEQLLKLVGHGYDPDQKRHGYAGSWWGTYGGEHGEHDPERTAFGDLVDFQGYAGEGERPDLSVAEETKYRDSRPDKGVGRPLYAEVPMVLIGQRPKRGNKLWDPEIHNEDNGLMGNSSLDENEEVPLHEIHYHSGRGWVKVKMPKGITVKARRADGLRYARVVEADVAEDLTG